MDWETIQRRTGITPEFVEFLGLTIAAPTVVYWLFRHHLSVDWDGGEGLLACFLGFLGLMAFGVRRMT
jgi:hypothetical protein